MTCFYNEELPVALTIAGSDSGAGAGIQADLLTFAAHGVFGTTAITCMTAQSPAGVIAVQAATPDFVDSQIQQLNGFFRISAAKTGMLFSADIIRRVCAFLRTNRQIAVVVDPVMVATSGAMLLRSDAVGALRDELLPLATLTTPNLDEAAVLLGQRPKDLPEMRDAALRLREMSGGAVLVKGGHMEDGAEIVDILATNEGDLIEYRHERVGGVNTHGSGCTLSAAIAANLAKGLPLPDAVGKAREYLLGGMRKPLQVAAERFIAHMP